MYSSESIEKLVDILSTLPTIGRKTAQRLTFYLLRQPESFIEQFSSALIDIKKNVKLCNICFNFTETIPCPICMSDKRNKQIICVVEEPNDILAIEKTHEFNGQYHVLHGVINPLEGISADDLKIRELISRVAQNNIEEVILALNPSVQGELTTFYIAKLLNQLQVKVSKIASGVPMGSAIEYADEATISRALEGRIII
jgi:recombination protein RecR